MSEHFNYVKMYNKIGPLLSSSLSSDRNSESPPSQKAASTSGSPWNKLVQFLLKEKNLIILKTKLNISVITQLDFAKGSELRNKIFDVIKFPILLGSI